MEEGGVALSIRPSTADYILQADILYTSQRHIDCCGSEPQLAFYAACGSKAQTTQATLVHFVQKTGLKHLATCQEAEMAYPKLHTQGTNETKMKVNIHHSIHASLHLVIQIQV